MKSFHIRLVNFNVYEHLHMVIIESAKAIEKCIDVTTSLSYATKQSKAKLSSQIHHDDYFIYTSRILL